MKKGQPVCWLLLILGLASCGATQHSAAGSGQPATSPALPSGDRRYRAWDAVHHAYGVDPLTESQAQGRWHWVLTFGSDGEVVRAVEVGPTGATFRRRDLYWRSGTLTIHRTNAWGVDEGTLVFDHDGLETLTARSGQIGHEGCHHRLIIVDAMGRSREQRCFDVDNRPMADRFGCERKTEQRNERGHVVRRACFSADGAKKTMRDGQHISVFHPDELGYDRIVDFLGEDGRPKSHGCAQVHEEFNAQGVSVRRTCTTATGEFYSESRTTYDRNGCETSLSYFDAQGAPRREGGFAKRVWVMDDHCTTLQQEIYDETGELLGAKAGRIWTYDARGQLTSTRCFDAKRSPMTCTGHHGTIGSEVRFEYDERGRIVRKRCFEPTGEPGRCSRDFPHDQRTEYGTDSLPRASTFFDEFGAPALALGAARIEWTYDRAQHLLSEKFFASDRTPTNGSGCHEVRFSHDEHGRLSTVRCLDPSSMLHASRYCRGVATAVVCFAATAAEVRIVRHSEARVENVHLDVNGIEVKRVDCRREPCFMDPPR